MASRPPPQSRSSPSTHWAPAQQTMPQPTPRWRDSPGAARSPRTTPSVVKKWPPPAKAHAPAPAPVVAAPKPSPIADKKKTVSAGFQSARAVFEAKQSPAASPLTPPSRRRLTGPTPTKTIVVKEPPRVLNLSSSSCSTVDLETDQELKEIAGTRRAVKTWQPVVEKEKPAAISVAPYPLKPVAAKASPQLVNPTLSAVSKKLHVGHSRSPEVLASAPVQQKQSTIDPSRLLAPFDTVPTLPDEVACVYDTAATEMQKSIKKVVRKLLKKDKARLEEFKMNARLFGTDFMDAHAYLDTLIKDFGSIRALQLVPCLLSIQPDILKSNALLLTARNYVLRNEETLDRECRILRATNMKETSKGSIDMAMSSVPTPSVVSTRAKAPSSPGIFVPFEPVMTAERVRDRVMTPVFSKTTTPTAAASSSPADQSAETSPVLVKRVLAAIHEPVKSEEPVPEPREPTLTEVKKSILSAVVTTPAEALAPPPPVKVIAPNPILKAHAESVTPSDSEEDDIRPESLFGEPIKPAPQKKLVQVKTKMVSAPTSPASSTHSFDDAEGLFGERLSLSSLPSERRRKTVTWGEPQTLEVSKPVRKAPPAPFIFGLATAGAFESDSDESDFDG